MTLPGYVQIEPVGQCNLRCRMCPIQFRRDGPPWGPPAFMPYETFTRLLDQFPGIEQLHLQGLGEPLMHPRFFDMVAYAAARGIRVSTNSNLTLLRPALAARCLASGLASLHVSIDGATAATYEAIRAGASYGRVVRNLTALTSLKRRRGCTTPVVRLIMVLMRRNLPELPALVQLAGDWGADEMFVQQLCHDFGESTLPAQYAPMRDFIGRESLGDDDLEQAGPVFARARSLADRLGLPLRLPRLAAAPSLRAGRRCDWPWRGAYVSYQGEAMPCCMLSTPDRTRLGNMITEGVAAVWHGAGYERFRRRLDSADPPEVCRSCAVYHGRF